MPFQVNAAGKFLISPGGAFWEDDECCCAKNDCYKLVPCQPTNTCNSCNPELFDEYEVTVTGLTGGNAQYNGTHIVEHGSGCVWGTGDLGSGQAIRLDWDAGDSRWEVRLGFFSIPPSSIAEWYGSTDTCTPLGAYTRFVGSEGTCGVALLGTNTTVTGEIIVNDDLSAYAAGDVIRYDDTCYIFIGEVECDTPITMTTFTNPSSCIVCEADCEACFPALLEEYEVTVFFDPSMGYPLSYNGTYTVTRAEAGTPGSYCYWEGPGPGGHTISMEWFGQYWGFANGSWFVYGWFMENFFTDWAGAPNPTCEPTYTPYVADLSVTSTCVVTEP